MAALKGLGLLVGSILSGLQGGPNYMDFMYNKGKANPKKIDGIEHYLAMDGTWKPCLYSNKTRRHNFKVNY